MEPLPIVLSLHDPVKNLSIVACLGTRKKVIQVLLQILFYRLNNSWSQPVRVEKELQLLDHLCVPPVASLQKVQVLLILWFPELFMALQVGLTRAEEQGRILTLHLLPTPLWMQPRATLNPFSIQPVFVLWIVPTHMQYLAK